MCRRALLLLLALCMTMLTAAPAAAKSPPILPPIPGGPPEITLQKLQVEATVAEGVARVRLDQTFVNQGRQPAEGTYLFPLPAGANVASFQMFVDGQAYSAEVLTADQARQVYEGIVRRNRDPALLQFVGQGLLQARVFPVPPGAQRLIRVEYEQVLPREGGLWELNIPMAGDSVPSASISVHLKGLGSGSVYSPTHTVAVTRRDGDAFASFEGNAVRGDFRLFFGSQGAGAGVNLLTYKAPGEDGYFLLLVNPPARAEAATVSKDVLLVIDLSGSMMGQKFEQAKGAALQILGALQPDDRFAVIGFHSDTVTYADELRGAGDAAKAMDYVRNLQLGGATNIAEAMARAQRIAGQANGRPQVIVLLTDGQPTAGETQPERIVEAVRSAATPNQRIFTFGVGYDVNTDLLDTMAQENRGRSDYVKPDENLERSVAAFWNRVGQPVLSDVALEWSGVKVEEVYPRPLPDLYLGSQMVVLGRYRQASGAAVTVRGQVNGRTETYRFDDLAFTAGDRSRDYIPRLWASRKVAYLLGEIRRNGPNQELIGEVVTLSQRFGIVTPYTSFFVNEPPGGVATAPTMDGAPSAEAKQSVANAVAAAPATGQPAVEAAKKVSEMRDATALSQAQGSAGADQVRTAGDKTFILRGGIWTDTAYKGGPLVYLKLGSDRYLALAAARADLARYLAAGSPLILQDGDKAYGVEIPGQEESAVDVTALAGARPGAPPASASGVPVAGGRGRMALPLLLGGGAAAGALGLWWRLRRGRAARP